MSLELSSTRAHDQSLLLANDDSPVKTDVAIAFHPSFLVEADLKNINSVPVGIFAGEEDDMMSIDQLNKVRFFFLPQGGFSHRVEGQSRKGATTNDSLSKTSNLD